MDYTSPNSSSSQSSYPQQHYAVLLSTVAELKNDLEKTMSKIRLLEDQNRLLTDNYKTVKEELLGTRSKYIEAKDCYMQTVAEKIDAERQYEAFMDRLKSQLIEKTKDFEQIREKLIPHDIDHLRIKVQEELEIIHKQQIQSIEQNLEKERDQFYAVRREYERNKAEYETLIQNQQQEIVSIRSERDEIESLLCQEALNQNLKEVEYNPSKDDKIRSQKCKIAEMQHLIDAIREEAKSCRSERDAVFLEFEKFKSSHETELEQVRVKHLSLEVENVALEERTNRLQTEIEKKDVIIRNLRLLNDEFSEKSEAAMKGQLDVEKTLAFTKEEFARQMELMKSSFEIDKADLQESIQHHMERLQEREDLLRRTQREVSEMQLKAETVEADLRRTHIFQMSELRKRYGAAELELADARQFHKTYETQTSQVTERLTVELEASQSELSRSKREKDILHSKLRELEIQLDGEKRAASAMKSELGTRIQQAEVTGRETKATMEALESSLRQSKEREMEVTAALQAAKESNNILEQRNQHMAAEMSQIRNTIIPKYKAKMEQVKRVLQAAVEKEKQKACEYKKKALQSHEKNKVLIFKLAQRQEQLVMNMNSDT